jgi:hypothetical protein
MGHRTFSAREQAAAHSTRQANRNIHIGDVSAESRAAYRANRKGSRPAEVDTIPAHRALVVLEPDVTPITAVSQEVVALNDCSKDNKDTSSNPTPALNLLPSGNTIIQLFPPAKPINLQIAYEMFRSTPICLEDAVCKGQVQAIENLNAAIHRYQAANTASGGAIWFRAIRSGSVHHYLYNPTTNRLQRVLTDGRMA